MLKCHTIPQFSEFTYNGQSERSTNWVFKRKKGKLSFLCFFLFTSVMIMLWVVEGADRRNNELDGSVGCQVNSKTQNFPLFPEQSLLPTSCLWVKHKPPPPCFTLSSPYLPLPLDPPSHTNSWYVCWAVLLAGKLQDIRPCGRDVKKPDAGFHGRILTV